MPSDSLPNYHLEQQKIKVQILAQESTIAKQQLDIMEMADRKARCENNITAAKEAISKLNQDLSGLEKTHGEVTEEVYEAMSASLDGKVDTDG
jgi:chromosome segregation ATPase